MRVLLTSTSYPRAEDDWRGVFIRNLAGALAALPEVRLSVWAPPGPLPDGATYACEPGEAAWLDRLASRGGIAQALRSRSLAALAAPVKLLRLLSRAYRRSDADLIHANWLQTALPLRGLRTPLVASVLGTDYALLRLPGMVTLLRRALKGRRCVIAPNAPWMMPRLQQCFGDLARVQPVPFGVDRRWFGVTRAPAPASALPPRRWLAVMRLTRAKLGSLPEWGEGLFGGRDELHLFGPKQDGLELPAWAHWHGPTHAAALAGEWMPGAAGLITLSAHDEGLPQILLEAMAAGLPVIASRIPGHASVVAHGVTGLLVATRGEFAAALASLAEPARNAAWGAAGREKIRAEYGSWDDCARRYLSLYREVLA